MRSRQECDHIWGSLGVRKLIQPMVIPVQLMLILVQLLLMHMYQHTDEPGLASSTH